MGIISLFIVQRQTTDWSQVNSYCIIQHKSEWRIYSSMLSMNNSTNEIRLFLILFWLNLEDFSVNDIRTDLIRHEILFRSWKKTKKKKKKERIPLECVSVINNQSEEEKTKYSFWSRQNSLLFSTPTRAFAIHLFIRIRFPSYSDQIV